MQTYKGRLDSFAEVKRVKNPSLTSSTSIRWTHPTSFAATPKTLAEAGFYFNPSWEDRDNVQCFNCGKELSGWANDDDPFEIHFTKCRATCDWASVRCGLRYDIDEDGLYVFNDKKRLPASKTMEKARLGTFINWPHDSTKGHGANSKKMAQAGFVSTPQVADEDEEDTAACFYCGCTLSGWERDDDPMKEHEKRAFKTDTPCAFFASRMPSSAIKPTSSAPSDQKPKTKSKAKPKQGVRQSRATKTLDSDEHNDAEESGDELELPPVRKGRSASLSKNKPTPEPSTEPSKRRITRGGSRAGSVIGEEGGGGGKARTIKPSGKGKKKEDIIEELDEEDSNLEVAKTKKGGTKKAPPVENSTVENTTVEDTTQEIKPKKAAVKPKKVKKPTASDSDTVSKSTTHAIEPKAKLVRSKSKALPSVESSESETHAESRSDQKSTFPSASTNFLSAPPPTKNIQLEVDVSTAVGIDQFAASSSKPVEAENGPDRQNVLVVEPLRVISTHADEDQAMNVVELSTDDEGSIISVEPAPDLEINEATPVPIAIDHDYDQDAMDDTPHGIPLRDSAPPSTPPPAPSPVLNPADIHLKPSPISPQPQAFLPPLAILPVSHIIAFTEPEQDMTVEEWIRHEIALQYAQLKGDGERRIEAFRLRANAMRQRIDTL